MVEVEEDHLEVEGVLLLEVVRLVVMELALYENSACPSSDEFLECCEWPSSRSLTGMSSSRIPADR